MKKRMLIMLAVVCLAAALLTAEGIMGGTGSDFAPQDNLSTEQALALLVRIYEYIW